MLLYSSALEQFLAVVVFEVYLIINSSTYDAGTRSKGECILLERLLRKINTTQLLVIILHLISEKQSGVG